MSLVRIVSGGQTGVDRGALDAALETGFPCGGLCPAARRAEDGPIPPRYPLEELRARDYVVRTRRNVADSDGTLVIHHGALEGGTALTVRFCKELQRPCLSLDATEMDAVRAAVQARAFIRRQGISVLNVAGPRQSKWPGAHGYARAVVQALLAPRERRPSGI